MAVAASLCPKKVRSYCVILTYITYRIAGNFREHKFSRIHARKKFRDFYFRATRSCCLSTPPTISRMEMVTHGVYRRNDSKISTLIKACRSLSAKNCHAKGRELTPRIYSQLRRVDRRSRKISAVCSMLLRQNRSTFRRFTRSRLEGTVLDSLSARNLWREKFSREQIFAS